MDASKIMKTLGGMEVYDEAARIQINGIKTTGTGAAYTATVKAIDTLTAGVGFIMIPHTVSTSVAPTLNVNNLGAKNIRMRLSSSMKSTITLPNADFIASGYPVKVIYDGNQWIIEDMVYPNAKRLYGTVSIESGGTGADTVAGARNALGLGNTAGALPIENGGTGCSSLADAKKLFSVADDDGVVPISSGGTGATTVKDARNALGLGSTSGALPIANGGTNATTSVKALENLGAVPNTRTVNGKKLSSDINITAQDVDAYYNKNIYNNTSGDAGEFVCSGVALYNIPFLLVTAMTVATDDNGDNVERFATFPFKTFGRTKQTISFTINAGNDNAMWSYVYVANVSGSADGAITITPTLNATYNMSKGFVKDNVNEIKVVSVDALMLSPTSGSIK